MRAKPTAATNNQTNKKMKGKKQTKHALVTFSCNGYYIPMLTREIRFTTANGARRSLANLISRHTENLRRFYGVGKKIDIEAWQIGAADTLAQTYIFI